jgi:hypothetical protein
MKKSRCEAALLFYPQITQIEQILKPKQTKPGQSA